MKTKLFFLINVILLTIACTKEEPTRDKIEEENEETTGVIITGNSMSGFNNNSKAATISYIPNDAKILFYSTGGIKANGDTLSYNNGMWTGLKDNKWYPEDGEANIITYYPILNNENMYDTNGELKDIVCCKTTAQPGNNINLSFSHIFSKVVLNIEKGLNDTIDRVNVNIPLRFKDFDFSTGNFSFYDNKNGNISFERNETGIYEFFVPSANDLSISTEIVCPNVSQTVKIGITKYDAGYEYVCQINKGKKKGIYTNDDFIAFTHLINGTEEYNEKKIEDFYYLENGKRVFRLHNSLYFTEEESALIQRIMHSGKSFDDIFDGNNNSLNNITLNNDKSSTYLGLFDQTSENAFIKNLTLINCNIKSKDKVALLVGNNKGTIDNCHVIGGNIINQDEKEGIRLSGFVFYNSGNIINSSISGVQIVNKYGGVGVFTYHNDGKIINCRIKNDLNQYPKYLSSVITTSNSGSVINVFVEKYASGCGGICNKNSSSGNFFNSVVPAQFKSKCIIENENQSAINGFVLYNDTQDEYSSITEKLNNWIENEGKTLYPQFIFKKWKTDDSQKVIFE